MHQGGEYVFRIRIHSHYSGSAAKTTPSAAIPALSLALSGREKGGRSSFLFDLWTAAVSAPATGCRRRTAQGWSSQLRPPLPRPWSRLSPTSKRRSRRRRTTPTTRSTDGPTSGGTPSRRAIRSTRPSGNGSLTRTAASRACSTPSQTSQSHRSPHRSPISPHPHANPRPACEAARAPPHGSTRACQQSCGHELVGHARLVAFLYLAVYTDQLRSAAPPCTPPGPRPSAPATSPRVAARCQLPRPPIIKPLPSPASRPTPFPFPPGHIEGSRHAARLHAFSCKDFCNCLSNFKILPLSTYSSYTGLVSLYP